MRRAVNYTEPIPRKKPFLNIIQESQKGHEMTVLDVLIRNSTTRQRLGPGSYELCNFCKTEFYSMALLRTHMETHFDGLSDRNKPAMSLKGALWKCADCEKVSHKHHMREHIEVHVTGLQYTCPNCGKQATSKNSLRSHMQRSCRAHKEFPC